ncbi:hypothetical protein D9757_010295 [Collybiopsis confluens]|uniref:Uncharacterized protein n=1 Tax=Collybiopsis confluens TaxID=2823264 RepID=A0A8H5LVG4_9AGAR|nr:hypothetical protein D9757_010295 [Collybiopsis confluens]
MRQSPLSADGGASGGETLVSESDEQELLATVRGLVGDVKSGMKLRIVWPDGKKRPRWLDFPEIGLNEVHPGHLIRLHQQYQPVRLDAHELSLPEDLRQSTCIQSIPSMVPIM